MIEFWIADLISDESTFSVNTPAGDWIFKQRDDYAELIATLENGQCANTYYAYNQSIDMKSGDREVESSIRDLIRICLVLSFVTSKCVTPSGTTNASDLKFQQIDDNFIQPRAINNLPRLELKSSFHELFSVGSQMTFSQFESRWMDLFLAHKISGFTCFTMEELFLSISVQLDIIKQTEKGANPKSALHTRQALKKVSMDLDIPTVNELFEKMRNDIVHEGKLSGSNFQNKTKSECSAVIADLLNWLDEYTAKVCFFDGYVSRFDRWKAIDIEHGLPSFSCISSDLI